jgi:hypothetical protein
LHCMALHYNAWHCISVASLPMALHYIALRDRRNSGLRVAGGKMAWPISPDTSSQLWNPRCHARSGPVRFAIFAILGSDMPLT